MSEEKIVKRLGLLTALKESLFKRLQTLNDMIPGMAYKKLGYQLVVCVRTVDCSIFETILNESLS